MPGNPMVVNFVHDEIVVEIDEEHTEAGRAWLERRMVDGMAEVVGPDVPVSVEIAVGDNWADKGKATPANPVPCEAAEPTRAYTHPGAPVPATSNGDLNPAKEEQAVNDYFDDEPVRIALYLDYRDGSADNYPEIALCGECADNLSGNVGELTRLRPGEAAECQRCGNRNEAACALESVPDCESTR